MREDLAGLLEKADLALATVSDVIEEPVLAPLAEAVSSVRTRVSYPDDVLVVALAGGTGSGKSSLFNALCEEELVDVGGIRPTTSSPSAAIPASAGGSMDGYLDRLGVAARFTCRRGTTCLLDLPDTDSVEVEHRHRVDALLPLVDLVVWVTDPEKYRDARLHDDYLRPMSEYSDQFLFVINQSDRLSESEADEVREDMRRALEEDRIETAEVMLLAAAPPSGPPIGIDTLREALERKRANRETLNGKLLTDLAATCRGLEREAGSGLDFDSRADDAVGAAAVALAAGDLSAAVETLAGLLEALEAESGGVTADKLAAIAAQTPDHLRRISAGLPAEREERGWLRRRKRGKAPSGPSRVDAARAAISEAVIRPARAVLARRALAVASVAELAVEIERMRPTPPSSGRGPT